MQRRTFLLSLASLPLTTALAAEKFPGKLILVELSGPSRSLAVYDPNTGARRRLSRAARQEEAPRLSPDGQTLIYACADLEADWHVRKMDLASGQESMLVESSSWPVCWVSNQQFIVNLEGEFWLCQSDGARIRKLADSKGNPAEGCMTPSGEFLFSEYGEPSQLKLLNLQKGSVRALGAGSNPVCAGDYFLFEGRQGYRRQSLSGGQSTPVKPLHGCFNVCYSADGKYLAWTEPAQKSSKLVLATRDYRVLRTLPWSYTINSLFWGV